MIAWDLQRFAGEKTERATPQRRREVRQKGQVARSVELTSAVTLMVAIVLLRVFGPRIWGVWVSFMESCFTSAGQTGALNQGTVLSLAHSTSWLFIRMLAPLLFGVALMGAAVGFAQVGPMFLPNLALPKFSRVNPLEGFKRMWSLRTLVEAGKSFLKLVIVGAVAYHGAVQIIGKIGLLTATSLPSLVTFTAHSVFQIAIEVGAAFVLLSFVDYLYQRFEFEKGIRMSREEIKQEFKQQEGDPLIRSQLRQRGRSLAMRRMMQDVPKADVVVTNPTHFAVALQYDATRMTAPVVLAKGQDELALKIREVAQQAGVPVMENRPLARQLHRELDIGDAVPQELFRAVAEVLAAVYRLRGKTSSTK